MTTFERFERSIPELMTELAPARVPDYFDDMLRQTDGATQRPAWSFPERWLPVEITARPLSMRSFPWRALLVLALVAGLIAAGLAVYVGSQNRVPAPFGPAGNGLLFFREADGSIASVDPSSGVKKTVVAASAVPRDPEPSRDGRRMALVTFVSETLTPIEVIAVDGGKVTRVAGDYREVDAVAWSPDDSQLAIVSNQGGLQSITVAASDGSHFKVLPFGRQVSQIAYLPDGRLVVIAAERPGEECPGDDVTKAPCALFLLSSDGAAADLLIPSNAFHGINTISTSPDGAKVLWVKWDWLPGRLHILDMATRVDQKVSDTRFPGDYAINRAWFSPDGRNILFDLFETAASRNHWAVVPVGGGSVVRLGQVWAAGNDTEVAWSPDGKSVLARYPVADGSNELWLLDPTGSGRDRKLTADVPYLPLWQRVAP